MKNSFYKLSIVMILIGVPETHAPCKIKKWVKCRNGLYTHYTILFISLCMHTRFFRW